MFSLRILTLNTGFQFNAECLCFNFDSDPPNNFDFVPQSFEVFTRIFTLMNYDFIQLFPLTFPKNFMKKFVLQSESLKLKWIFQRSLKVHTVQFRICGSNRLPYLFYWRNNNNDIHCCWSVCFIRKIQINSAFIFELSHVLNEFVGGACSLEVFRIPDISVGGACVTSVQYSTSKLKPQFGIPHHWFKQSRAGATEYQSTLTLFYSCRKSTEGHKCMFKYIWFMFNTFIELIIITLSV